MPGSASTGLRVAPGSWARWVRTDLVESFRGREWLLAPIGAIKLIAAIAPLALARSGWPARRLTRCVCWLGTFLLIGWGGLNTAVGNLVLSDVIQPESGFDRPGMIGHAYLWDPTPRLGRGPDDRLGRLKGKDNCSPPIRMSAVPDAERRVVTGPRSDSFDVEAVAITEPGAPATARSACRSASGMDTTKLRSM